MQAVEKKHPGKFTVETKPAQEHKDEIKGHGIESHGVVCLDGAGKKLWMHADHKMSEADLEKGLGEVLAALK